MKKSEEVTALLTQKIGSFQDTVASESYHDYYCNRDNFKNRYAKTYNFYDKVVQRSLESHFNSLEDKSSLSLTGAPSKSNAQEFSLQENQPLYPGQSGYSTQAGTPETPGNYQYITYEPKSSTVDNSYAKIYQDKQTPYNYYEVTPTATWYSPNSAPAVKNLGNSYNEYLASVQGRLGQQPPSGRPNDSGSGGKWLPTFGFGFSP